MSRKSIRLPPPKIKASFLSSSLHSDKSFVRCCVKSKQVSHECKTFHYFVFIYVIHETQLLCLDSVPRTIWPA